MNIWLVNNSTFSSTFDNVLQLLGLVLMFCFVLGATYLTSKYVGKIRMSQLKDKNFRVIETVKVAPNKFLQLVKMGNKYVVIGIGKDDIHVITELSEEDVILPEENSQQGMKFSDFIAKVQVKHMSTKDTDDENESTNEQDKN